MASPGRSATPLLGSMSAEGLQELLAASLTLTPAPSSPDAQGMLLLLTLIHLLMHLLVHPFVHLLNHSFSQLVSPSEIRCAAALDNHSFSDAFAQ